ncbi:hypothetical protein DKX38_020557 [Salix brachista]|uniref:EF-hand domain-containing protein n=1 Tax=Salix brachista TaxID=2182728 RepID=A0A5N5KAH1_9ROSI|nr:hypothetical protein DKX38_020557 [Salix brachista]
MGFDMGIKGTSKDAMTMKAFKEWVLRDLDADQDGKITKAELAEAVRRRGEWFAGLKAWKGIRSADSNRNGVVDDIEITNLAEFAQKHLGCEELEDAMPGGWFTRWKGKRGIRSADSDGNGFIEESEINNLVEFAQKYLGGGFDDGNRGETIQEPWLQRKYVDGVKLKRDLVNDVHGKRSGPFAKWESSRAPCADSGGMDFGDGKHRRSNSDSKIGNRKSMRENRFRSLLKYITEAGRLSAPAKSEAKSMFLTEEQLKEVFKRFEAVEEPVLDRVDLEKAFNHFGLFSPHHVATVFDAKKDGCAELTELDDLVHSAVRPGYTVS